MENLRVVTVIRDEFWWTKLSGLNIHYSLFVITYICQKHTSFEKVFHQGASL